MNPIKCCVFLVLLACAGDGGADLSNRDPRCVAACTDTPPRDEGVGAVCDDESRVQCVDQCEARIANVSSLCQTCLIEDASFGPRGGDDGDPVFCSNNSCTLTTEFGTCTYNLGDEAGRLRCMQMVDPRREVACRSEFRPATECAAVCM
jgi:hypothetical protein